MRIILAALIGLCAVGAHAQERTVGDFKVTSEPNAATRTDDYVASYAQRDIGIALRCKAGQQDILFQFFGAQSRLKGETVGSDVTVQLRIDEGEILTLKGTVSAILGDRVEVQGGDAEAIGKIGDAGRVGVRYTIGGGTATTSLVLNSLEQVVKALQRACRPRS
jgi:hypothetical protein